MINIAGLTLLTAGRQIYDSETLHMFYSVLVLHSFHSCLLIRGFLPEEFRSLCPFSWSSDDVVKETSLSHLTHLVLLLLFRCSC